MKKTLYFKLNTKAKYPYQKYIPITKKETEKMEFIEEKESYCYIDKIYKEKTLKEFSYYYEIPYNTVRQWKNEERKPPKWVYNLFKENMDLKTKGVQLSI